MQACVLSIPSVELSDLSLMSHLNHNQLSKVKSNMKFIRLKEGEHLFEHGEVADKFYLVTLGQIKLFRVSLEGSERVIDVIHQGKLFAETLLLSDENLYPFGAEAILDTELIAFDSKVFRDILKESNHTCFALMSEMNSYLNQYLDQVDCLTLQNASYRLVNYLLNQIPEEYSDDEPYVIQLRTTKTIIASCLSIKPETFSRILKTLRNQKLIEVKGKNITIKDIDELKRMAA